MTGDTTDAGINLPGVGTITDWASQLRTNWSNLNDALFEGDDTALDIDQLHAPALASPDLNGDYLYAGAFDGADADARLSNAVAELERGQTLYLEDAGGYGTHTIDVDRVKVVHSGRGSDGAAFTDLTFASSRGHLEAVRGTITITGTASSATHIYNADSVTVDADLVILSNLFSGEVTFASGTSGGLIDSSVATTVTDNGDNNVGDVP